ncbi:aminomethyl-transferring glycine dehydrogenase [Reichenbachiella carrageenanivorans]|uniref:Glycine dehydrogenase (decarboxylating) n=1 Tax=Reichenbachiella carrageenanivorans TaxID=2979869 RepID=A0ABY6D713_9BACT|nr:aminomethyl-transferring glycine dehydrogenase [Reichenbachiella carrageenanivorans]UXX79625.1 aminomethyl-transferring glycine dehydrogenase [Reichenbachiella carrageenanivorans]
MIANLNERTHFQHRHNGPSNDDISQMLDTVGVDTVDELIDQTVPENIRKREALNIPEALDEFSYVRSIKEIASKNKVFKSFIGLGYYNCVTPAVIQRNILENPGWYTAYTPYQAEIAQGRLEALVNFQTMVSDLTGMEIANASLLDEATAAAEAMTMLFALRKKEKKTSVKYFVDERIFPQTLDVLKTRALPLGIELEIGKYEEVDISSSEYYGLMVQYPNAEGSVEDYRTLFATAQDNQVFITVATDLMSMVLLTPPGEMGADVVVGTTQRFGVPMGFGGPHAGFFATKDEFKRQIPGRIIGVSQDSHGNKAYRMALQTREQHIRREKATSNICTAQVLLGVIAGAYAVYHGPKGLKRIASRIHGLAQLASKYLTEIGFVQENEVYFDTLKIKADDALKQQIREESEAKGINFNYYAEDAIGIAFDETHTVTELEEVVAIFSKIGAKTIDRSAVIEAANQVKITFNGDFDRTSKFLEHPVYQKYQSEHEMLRYLKRLENKDLSLAHSMISLGSCTMKLNATSEMIPITWPEFAQMHPFAPVDQTDGYRVMISNLTEWLSEITGFYTTSLQPNSGAQGEYAGLLVIKAYLEDKGEGHRDVTLIPSSAHGTNPASAVMAGNKVVIVKCDEKGNIDVADLKAKAEQYKDTLSSLMITYPSTHGVFEESVIEICEIIHEHGGQVYMDGANMNAQVGLTSPGHIGADVCHLNLHKTFAIPHGGGGPGIGPIGVAKHLAPYLPGSPLVDINNGKAITAISAAPFGSAGVLPISYGYIAMMGADGLLNATKMAILNANYIKTRLETKFPILYTGINGRCAHEMIVDCRAFKAFGIEVEDIAKRLMDYGFHAPTVSFPVAGTLMIEPTESETKEELDRFCDALLQIREEVEAVASGNMDPVDNVLKNAPHTADSVLVDDWNHGYSRSEAVYPLDYLRANKFWPSVGRVDNAYGDRNLFCSCIPVEEFEEVVEA